MQPCNFVTLQPCNPSTLLLSVQNSPNLPYLGPVKREVRYIAIEGVIGAGKTSLARLLQDQLNGRLVLEHFEENPFLARFYQDPERYAFQTQIFFLLTRFKQLQQLAQQELFSEYLITDYIFEKDKIFAHLNLQDDELALYDMLVANIEKSLPKPDPCTSGVNGIARRSGHRMRAA